MGRLLENIDSIGTSRARQMADRDTMDKEVRSRSTCERKPVDNPLRVANVSRVHPLSFRRVRIRAPRSSMLSSVYQRAFLTFKNVERGQAAPMRGEDLSESVH